MEKYKWLGNYHLDWESRREQSNNLIDLKRVEIDFKCAKAHLTQKINFMKESKFYVNINSIPEYVYYLGYKELLKRVNKKRKYIKDFIKNMNKVE